MPPSFTFHIPTSNTSRSSLYSSHSATTRRTLHCFDTGATLRIQVPLHSKTGITLPFFLESPGFTPEITFARLCDVNHCAAADIFFTHPSLYSPYILRCYSLSTLRLSVYVPLIFYHVSSVCFVLTTFTYGHHLVLGSSCILQYYLHYAIPLYSNLLFCHLFLDTIICPIVQFHLCVHRKNSVFRYLHAKVCIVVYDRRFLLSPLPFELHRVLVIFVSYKYRAFFTSAVTLHSPAYSSAFSICSCNPSGVLDILHEIIREHQSLYRIFPYCDSLLCCFYRYLPLIHSLNKVSETYSAVVALLACSVIFLTIFKVFRLVPVSRGYQNFDMHSHGCDCTKAGIFRRRIGGVREVGEAAGNNTDDSS